MKNSRRANVKIEIEHANADVEDSESNYRLNCYSSLQVYGVIYVIDSSDHSQLERSKEIFGAIMSNDLLTGKPTLVIANKQDRPGALDSLDICDYFEVEYLANLFRTPCLVEGLGKYNDQFDSQATIHTCNWLAKTILENYKTIQNKIRFLRYFTQNESVSNEEIPRRYRRPATGRKKVSVKFEASTWTLPNHASLPFELICEHLNRDTTRRLNFLFSNIFHGLCENVRSWCLVLCGYF